MNFLELLKAFFLGVVQGITEWLPISSTGHMILIDEFMHMGISEEAKSFLFVVIQFASMLAVLVLFFNELWPKNVKIWKLWSKILVGIIPVGIAGVLVEDFLDSVFYNWQTICVSLIVFGVLFILVERKNASKEYRVNSIDDLTYSDALKMGLFQVLSLIPGTSRSGSTILGGLLSGVSRHVSAAFCFYMAIPVMGGASLLKILKAVKNSVSFTRPEILVMIVACIVAFVVSLFVVKALMSFVKKHSLECFGWYRIILGAILPIYFLLIN